MFNFGIRLILLLLLIGGVIAIVGDYMGRFIGRRRLTIFGLRPKHTAFLITIITGVLSVLITILIMLAVSQDARTALFGLDDLRQIINEKKLEIKEAKDELEKVDTALKTTVEELAGTSEKLEDAKNNLLSVEAKLKQAQQEIRALNIKKQELEKAVETSRKGKLLFRIDQVILTSLIKAGPEKVKLETGLKQILSAADAYIRSLGIQDEKHLIYVSPQDFDNAVAALQSRSGENIVLVTANRNALYGEQVPVRLEIVENKRIYKTGQFIAQTTISANLSVPEIEQEIKKFLLATHQIGKTDGVLPDPSGSVGNITYSEILSLAKRIKGYKDLVSVKAFAKDDIFSIGPMELTFRIFYQ